MSAMSSSHAPSSTQRPRHRVSTAITEDGNQTPTPTSQPLSLPDLEPPIAPLNPAARQALAALLQSNTVVHLKNHLSGVGESLTDNAGLVNDRLTDARLRLQKRKDRGENDEDTSAEAKEVEELEREVVELTERLEGRMRGIVDAEVKIGDIMGVVEELGKECEEESEEARRRQSERERRRRVENRNGDAAGDEEGEEDVDEDGDVGMQDAAAEEEEMKPETCPSMKMREKLEERKAQWEELSLTERYTTNNAYIGFYRMTHEAKFPNDSIPPLPPASAWFEPANLPQTNPNTNLTNSITTSTTSATLPNRSTTQSQTQQERQQQQPTSQSSTLQDTFQSNLNSAGALNASPEDEDVAIAHERIAPKCPLTLLPFRHPVTSAKCPHSFEKEAITDMIRKSKDIRRPDGSQIHPRSRRGAAGEQRIHFVRCPVCEVHLSLADLRDDPVLMRRVRRAEEIEAAEREEEEEFGIGGGSGGGRGLRRGVTVDDIEDDGDDVGTRRWPVKKERGDVEEERRLKIKKEMSRDVSIVPDTQYAAVDDDDDDDEE